MKSMSVEEVKEKILPILKNKPVSKASVFGSCVRGEMTEESDIDILVELNKRISLLDFSQIKFELEQALEHKVDLLDYKAIRPRLKPYILGTEISIYEA